jgi:class 3 adenylate cyclase
MKPPPVKFVDGPDGRVYYQVLGDGPVDLCFFPYSGRNNLDVIWENPLLERYLRRLASFSRLILVNSRGSGLSDPIRTPGLSTVDEAMMDFRIVLDEVGSQRAAFFAHDASAPGAMFFAATFPDRTEALALLNPVATFLREADYPWGYPPAMFDRFFGAFINNWGTGTNLDYMAPHLAGDERLREWFARMERLGISHAMAETQVKSVISWDVRGVLPSIKVPTLVISHTDVPWIRLGHGRYVADHIPGSRYIERPGPWGLYWIDDVEWTLGEVQAFLTGSRAVPDLDDRVLATVLFTDIVGSTERAATLGDQRWRIVLGEHEQAARREVERYRGRLVKLTGDGILATFDGPTRATRCAVALTEAVQDFGIELRAGLHIGEVEMLDNEVAGIAVHIAQRVMGEAGPGEVLVSGAVPPLVAGSGIDFDDRGTRELKGVPGEWKLYSVKS